MIFEEFEGIRWLLMSILVLSGGADSQSIAPLRRRDVREGSCILPYPTAAYPNFFFAMKTIFGLSTPYYVPMGSKHLYRAYSEYLLGRPSASQAELDAMNLRIKGSIAHSWHTTGYNASMDQQCSFQGSMFRANCYATKGTSGTNLDIIRQTTDTMVYTDNENVYLFVRCVNGKENDWKLLSMKPTVDSGIKVKVLDVVRELGFTDSSNWAEARYS